MTILIITRDWPLLLQLIFQTTVKLTQLSHTKYFVAVSMTIPQLCVKELQCDDNPSASCVSDNEFNREFTLPLPWYTEDAIALKPLTSERPHCAGTLKMSTSSNLLTRGALRGKVYYCMQSHTAADCDKRV